MIALPHNLLTEASIYALKKGIDVIQEKPFSTTLENCHNLLEAWHEHKPVFILNLPRRYKEPFNIYKEKYCKSIGEVGKFDFHYSLGLDTAHSGWRSEISSAGGGCLIDMGFHYIDLVLHYFGFPESVHSTFIHPKTGDNSSIENTIDINFKYSNGMIGRVFISRTAIPKLEYIRIFGSEGRFETDGSLLKVTDNKDAILYKDNFQSSNNQNVIDYYLSCNKSDHNAQHKRILYYYQIMQIISAIYKSIVLPRDSTLDIERSKLNDE